MNKRLLRLLSLCGENFVTPFLTLAMIKGSLPTDSTTPDRLRWRARPSDDDLFTVFFEEEKHKKKNRARHLVVIYTPKEAHSRIFRDRGVSNRVKTAGQRKILFSGRPTATSTCINL